MESPFDSCMVVMGSPQQCSLIVGVLDRFVNRPIVMTFFEKFEAEETARLVASPRDSFSVASLNVKSCDDISHGVFARSTTAALHPSTDHTV